METKVDIINEYKILVEIFEEKTLARARHEWKDIIKMYLITQGHMNIVQLTKLALIRIQWYVTFKTALILRVSKLQRNS
jgi:hypothetical protein